MNETLEDLTKEYVAALPKEIQEVIKTYDWSEVMWDIGKRHNLSDEEANDLETELTLVLVGLTKIEDLAQNIEDSVGVTSKQAEEIVDEAMDEVFNVVSDLTIDLIKTKIKDTKQNWGRNMKFILSGGDYLFFLDKLPKHTDTPTTQVKPVSLPAQKEQIDLKDTFTI